MRADRLIVMPGAIEIRSAEADGADRTRLLERAQGILHERHIGGMDQGNGVLSHEGIRWTAEEVCNRRV